ncbi:hypothetical protein PK35_07180 [Tamlana nanhaiensis]|uniref:Uncharacterized protein n=1 Tax=Neotamlana nanhaiensis TaxID=1382798 RepID=A0A0D7W3J4_9FLAO|nr:hypothetical protein PK35_07180 [Tamlana nanhaiensis]
MLFTKLDNSLIYFFYRNKAFTYPIVKALLLNISSGINFVCNILMVIATNQVNKFNKKKRKR